MIGAIRKCHRTLQTDLNYNCTRNCNMECDNSEFSMLNYDNHGRNCNMECDNSEFSMLNYDNHGSFWKIIEDSQPT
ncbi:hypothetical protein QE152_g18034 [Popillia japonica]|uniref:Uncharacterized protein n=1 Tax=Popillia japonica TaxID=7064 RepID=A0AAW1L0I0_POPJA